MALKIALKKSVSSGVIYLSVKVKRITLYTMRGFCLLVTSGSGSSSSGSSSSTSGRAHILVAPGKELRRQRVVVVVNDQQVLLARGDSLMPVGPTSCPACAHLLCLNSGQGWRLNTDEAWKDVLLPVVSVPVVRLGPACYRKVHHVAEAGDLCKRLHLRTKLRKKRHVHRGVVVIAGLTTCDAVN